MLIGQSMLSLTCVGFEISEVSLNENQITTARSALAMAEEAVDAYTAFLYLAGPIGLFKDLINGTIARAVEYEKTYKPNYKQPSSPGLYAKGTTGYWTVEMSRTGKIT